MYVIEFIRNYFKRVKILKLPFPGFFIGYLKKHRVLLRLTILCCVFFRLVQVCGISVTASETDEDYEHFYLEATYQKEFGLVILSLLCDGKTPTAGIFLQITYDNEIMSFTSAQKGSAKKSLEFTCSLDDNGKINVLFDGTQNDGGGGALASFCFELPDDEEEKDAEFYFGLECNDPDSVFNISEEGFSRVKVILDGYELKTDCAGEELKVIYVGFSQKPLARDNIAVRLVGTVSGNMYEEVGFEVCIVDLCEGSVTNQILSRKELLYNLFGVHYLPGDFGGKYFYTSKIAFSDENLVCVYIRPFAVYNGYKFYGDEHIQLFDDGRFIG